MPSFIAKRHHVVLIAYPGVTLLDVIGPAEVFSSAQRAGCPAYEVTVASPEGGLIETDSGVQLGTVSISEIGPREIHTLLIHVPN